MRIDVDGFTPLGVNYSRLSIDLVTWRLPYRRINPNEWQTPFFMSIHIGHRIQQEIKNQGRTITWFAKQICCTRENVYDIFRRKNIDTELLSRISDVLSHNFFQDLANSFINNDNNCK